MASYHFHFQQQDDGPREDVRTTSTSVVPFVSPYIAVPYSDSSLHAFQRRARPTQAPHVTSFVARPARPRRRRRCSRSRSYSTSRSRSRRRRRTRRSRSSTPRTHRRSARSCSPSPRSRASLVTRTTATQTSPISNAAYSQYPAAPCSAPPSTFVVPGTAVSAKVPKHRLCLLRCHRATHDHKSFHLKPRLFTFVH